MSEIMYVKCGYKKQVKPQVGDIVQITKSIFTRNIGKVCKVKYVINDVIIITCKQKLYTRNIENNEIQLENVGIVGVSLKPEQCKLLWRE